MYRAFGLLRPDSDFTIEQAHARLTTKFPGSAVTRDGDRVVVSRGEWWIALALVSGPAIRLETEGLLGHLAGLEPAEALALTESDRRVEVWTDVPDPFIEHFNDYLLVVEVLKTFKGLVAVDPKEPAVL
ncbi:hypothetical protein [Frigoriglobus tundricola]|uniref:Uncharacterized protein n=1 Tax=Frigoriglobus tundricola TaxID=2774151 RepID=A0A6M5YZT5_9BACT|nr:hypothetical protein [Frigoriglobus tundricola]QJW98930.1 hypothetical protein FTUN_6525 [Frigoriglobus tundricola]